MIAVMGGLVRYFLTRPILWHDGARAKKDTPCRLLKKVNVLPGQPPLLEVQFEDGRREFVYEEDIIEETSRSASGTLI